MPIIDRYAKERAEKRWIVAPLSDRRGSQICINIMMMNSFEKELRPWQRWAVKSNGRRYVPRNRKIIRSIRGIHVRNMGWRGDWRKYK